MAAYSLSSPYTMRRTPVRRCAGAPVHVEAYFYGDAPNTFDSLDAMEIWIRSNHGRIG